MQQEELRYNATRRVTFISATTNSLLAILKVVVGFFGQSHALIADGIHSLSDLVSDGLVLIAAKVGSRHPDKEHPYGHHRVETIAAIIIGIILLIVSAGIIYESAQHLMTKRDHWVPDFWVLIMAGISIFANEGLYRYNVYVGNKIHSNLLISNAWHNRSDAYTSIIVFLSALGAMLGWHFLDPLAALVIAGLIIKIAIKIIWDSTNELIDASADEKTVTAIKAVIQATPGVKSVHQLRTRLHGGHIFIDLHIIVEPFISVSEGHHIGQQVHVRLIEQFRKVADVTVHIDPEDDEKSMPSFDLPTRDKLLPELKKCWQTLPGFNDIQRTTLHYLDGKIIIELYLPKRYAEANDLVSHYRAALQRDDIKTIKIYYQ